MCWGGGRCYRIIYPSRLKGEKMTVVCLVVGHKWIARSSLAMTGKIGAGVRWQHPGAVPHLMRDQYSPCKIFSWPRIESGAASYVVFVVL
jgi:hypothetical protein